MPILKSVKVLEAKEIWKAPDGQRTLFAIKVGTEHGEVELKTWSQQIAKDGWTGDLDTYEKEGKNGSETFAKQPPKEGGFQGGFKGAAKAPTDPRTMYISYAKDVVVALIGKELVPGEMHENFQREFDAAMDFIIRGGERLQEPDKATKAPVDPPVTEGFDHIPSPEELNGLWPDE